ncbi:MAG: hypothetical protein FJX77_10675 [Armatimonadetes bacterium]|nr:hypothetical protein [Armatimonadota bacterium]
MADDFDLLLDLAYDRVSRTWYVLYRDPIQAGVKAIDSQHRTRLWRLPTWLIPESILFRAGGVVRLLGVNLEETLRSLTPGFHADDYSYIGLEVSLQSTTPGVPGEIQVTQLGRGGGQVLDYDLGLDPHRISHRRAVARQLAQDLSFQHISLGARSLTRSRIAYSPRDTWMAWSHPMFPNTWLHLLDTGTGAPTQRDLAAFGPVRDLHPPETAIVAITTTGGVTSVGLVSRTQGQAVQRVVRFNQWDGRLRLLQEAPGLLARPLERWPGEPLDFVFR